MTKEQKIIRSKVGFLELAEQLGNVSQTCKVMGYSRHLSDPAPALSDPRSFSYLLSRFTGGW